MPLSGGCQCGAVRFRVDAPVKESSLCYCRMCQKATAATGLALATVDEDNFIWVRGEPKWFQSSNFVRRGFCIDCGTPLAYNAPDEFAVCVMTFDEPESVKPQMICGAEGKPAFVDQLSDLPYRKTSEDESEAPFLKSMVSFQHPDYETSSWPEDTK